MVEFKSPEFFYNIDCSDTSVLKYFPPGKIVKLRNDITNFIQLTDESLYEAWERYRDLQRKCPHHGLPDWLIV